MLYCTSVRVNHHLIIFTKCVSLQLFQSTNDNILRKRTTRHRISAGHLLDDDVNRCRRTRRTSPNDVSRHSSSRRRCGRRRRWNSDHRIIGLLINCSSSSSRRSGGKAVRRMRRRDTREIPAARRRPLLAYRMSKVFPVSRGARRHRVDLFYALWADTVSRRLLPVCTSCR